MNRLLGFLIAITGAAAALAQTPSASTRTDEILNDAEIRRAGDLPGRAGDTARLAAEIPLPAIPAGPFQPTWDSLRANWRRPPWFDDAKFGLSMHWGLYSVPARQSEWYVRYMYGGNAAIMRDQVAKYGPLDQFGYKDFIPMFTAEKWDPAAWATLFRKSGAKFIVPTVEHHDGFSLWDSAYNKYNAKRMGLKRDLIADLAAAVRREGLKFGVANHSMEHFTFIRPPGPEIKTDLEDPAWRDFYSVADRSEAARERFNRIWLAKNFELIDRFQPDLLWFDNGLNARALDPLKLQVAAYYYNRAAQWGKPVSLSTKGEGEGAAYLAGTIRDYERQGRIYPREVKNFAWEVDDPIGNKFGYVREIVYKPASLLVHRLIDTVAMGGVYMMNLSPLPDGTLPAEQQERLLAMGGWLGINGDAIYGTRAWTKYGEGPFADAPPAPWRAPGPDDPPGEAYSSQEFRFTRKGDILYAILMGWPENGEVVITALATGAAGLPEGRIAKVELLGMAGALAFRQDTVGLHVTLPPTKPADLDFAYPLRITGLHLR